MYPAGVAVETPSRILRRVLQAEQEANDLDDLPAVDMTEEDSAFPSSAPPTPASKPLTSNRILTSPSLTPDSGPSPAHSTAQSSTVTGSSRTVRPGGVQSAASTPSIRSSPSGRARRPADRRGAPEPLPALPDDEEESVIEEDGEEEEEVDSLESSVSPSHVQLRRGAAPQRRRKVPSLSSASSFSAASSGLPSPPQHDYLSSPEKSHRERSVSILSQSLVEPLATDDDDVEDLTQELPSGIASPFQPTPSRSAHPHRPSALSQMTPGPASTSSPPQLPSGDFETPRPASTAADAERRKTHVLSTLRMTAVRSAAKSRMKKGTPFVRRLASAARDSDEEEEVAGSSTSSSVGGDTESSNDLTTFQRVNASMPDVGAGTEGVEAAGAAGRFNGGKLNAYLHTLNTHLTEENQGLHAALDAAQAEVERLRGGGNSDDDEEGGADVVELRQEVAELKALREGEVNADAARVDELLVELENRDRALHEQEAGFNEKMAQLEKELTAVMQEQEAQLEEARHQLANRSLGDDAFHANQEAKLAECQRRTDEAEEEAEALREERDRLQELLDEAQDGETATATPNHRFQLAQEQVERLEGLLASKEAQLRGAAQRAQQDAEALEDVRGELADVKQDAARALREVQARDRQLAAAARSADDLQRELEDWQHSAEEVKTLRKQLERRADDAALALDDATARLQGQLRAAEVEQRRLLDEAAALRRQLREEREQRASNADDADAQHRLVDEADQLRRRLADSEAENALLSRQAAERDALVASARREAGRLRAMHESPEAIQQKEGRIAELEAEKNELARRLRQAELTKSRAGVDTPAARSFAFRSVVGIPTPKTPGHYLRNMSPFDRSALGDETVAPLLEQINELEAEIEELRRQLEAANRQIDEKVGKLEAATFERREVSTDLAAARRKIVDLESQLERALAQRPSGSGGHRGSEGRELEAARREIAGLEDELRSMRSRVRDLVTEQDTTMRMRASTEQDLQRARAELHRRSHNDGALDRLLDEKAELLDKLRAMNEHAERLAADLARATSHGDALERDRADLVHGIDDLRHDLHRVRSTAADLGRDLHHVKRTSTAAGDKRVASTSNGHDEAKSLLTMIRYLKAKYVREASLRADLAHQKVYLGLLLREKQTSMDATKLTLARFGLTPSPDEGLRPALTMKMVGLTVLAVVRMRLASERWRATEASKLALRSTWEGMRGRPWTPPM